VTAAEEKLMRGFTRKWGFYTNQLSKGGSRKGPLDPRGLDLVEFGAFFGFEPDKHAQTLLQVTFDR